MDEISFRVSNQLEALQVHASVFAQQGQQWVVAWLTQINQFCQELYRNPNMLYLEDIMQHILNSFQNGLEQIQIQYYSAYFNATKLYRQVGNTITGGVSGKEASCFIAGLAMGSLIGYYVGVNWKYSGHHMHHIKAIICYSYIGTEGVMLTDDGEMPIITKSNELLVQVKAASVNVVDTKICSGYSKIYRRLLNSGVRNTRTPVSLFTLCGRNSLKPILWETRHKELPVTLGRDCTGVIVDIGQCVTNFDIGDEVFLAVPSWAPGTLAEYIVVPESQVVKRPKNLSFEASASLPYCGCLAWDALVHRSIIKEGNAKGRRVLICGGNTPIGCTLIQLVKLWGGHVVTICRPNFIPVAKALGADDVISFNGVDIEKNLKLYDKYDAIFYTGGQLIDEYILRRYLVPYGSYVSTVPEQLTSDSLGFICGSIFAGCVRIKLLVQYMFGFNIHQWKEGSKINATYLQALTDLAEADQVQPVVDRVFAPHNFEQALQHILDPDAIGSTIITFQ